MLVKDGKKGSYILGGVAQIVIGQAFLFVFRQIGGGVQDVVVDGGEIFEAGDLVAGGEGLVDDAWLKQGVGFVGGEGDLPILAQLIGNVLIDLGVAGVSFLVDESGAGDAALLLVGDEGA